MRLFGEEAVTNLKSEQWKFRKEAMEEILGKIEAFQGSEADSHAGECIQGFSHLPGWSEKNFQVFCQKWLSSTSRHWLAYSSQCSCQS